MCEPQHGQAVIAAGSVEGTGTQAAVMERQPASVWSWTIHEGGEGKPRIGWVQFRRPDSLGVHPNKVFSAQSQPISLFHARHLSLNVVFVRWVSGSKSLTPAVEDRIPATVPTTVRLREEERLSSAYARSRSVGDRRPNSQTRKNLGRKLKGDKQRASCSTLGPGIVGSLGTISPLQCKRKVAV